MKLLTGLLIMLLIITGCTDYWSIRQYKSLVKKELASGRCADSIFLGIYLGMTRKAFFAHCWEMNKRGLITDGLNNTAVLYRLDHHGLKNPASMNFYPQFEKNRIVRMAVIFQYDGWAPWNKALGADSLQQDVLRLFRKWYPEGADFIELNDEKRGPLYIKVNGNRRIIIGRYSNIVVKADFADLPAVQQTGKKNGLY